MTNTEYANIISIIEDDEKILSFNTSDGLPIYLMAKKYLIFDKLMPKLLEGMTVSAGDREKNFNALIFLCKAFIHNSIYKKKFRSSEILFYSVSRPTMVSERYINRYTDLLAKAFDCNSMTIEGTSSDWTWCSPRYNNRVIYDGPSIVVGTIFSKLLFRKDVRTVTSFVKYFSELVKKNCGVIFKDSEISKISIDIAQNIAIMRYKTKWLERYIPKSVKLVIMVGGSYPYYYPINKMLKRRGIISSDIQHGFITKTNPVYSYTSKLCENKVVIEGTTDYFLTYGEWWNSQILNPTKKVAIGNPYRNFCIKELIEKHSVTKNKILLIGCEVSTKMYVKWTKQLSDTLPEFEVCFRPHPGERRETFRILEEENIDIDLDDEKEIYNSLNNASTVISEISTVLFEAIGICDNIIVMNTSYSRAQLPYHPFTTCTSIAEVVQLLKCDSIGEKKTIDNEIWSTNSINKFKHFVDDVLS